jgi:hypothetical protein
MKRALAIAVAVCTLGIAGFSQIALKGSWTATVCLVPETTISSTLSLTYTVAGFDITSTTGFGMVGLTAQSFSLKGAFGPFKMDGGMRFEVSPPSYSRSWLTTAFDFAGVGISLLVRHWLPGHWDPLWTGDPCLPQTPYTAGMQYTFTTTVAPLSIRIRFLDCCYGIEFQDLLVTLKGVDLCCGIKYDAEFSFTKLGFHSLVLKGISIPLCCGVSLDVAVTYTVTSKSVTITPKFAGFAEACFTVWGDAVWTTPTWSGIRIDAYRIRCTIADCNYLEYVHAFAPGALTIPKAIRDKFLAACGEYEYLELGFCGPGCCGGRYTVTLRTLWGTVTPGIFGITRFVGTVAIPIMTNFTLNLDFVAPASACASARFCLGWTFTF